MAKDLAKETHRLAKEARQFSRPYRVDDGRQFRLKHHDPGDTGGLTEEKKRARDVLQHGIEVLADLQDKLYAQDRWSVLLVFQAIDAAGKDGTIKHVMSGVNPQGVQVHPFKKPSAEELDHDYLWRAHARLPGRGCIGIFNRSYYEEVLVARVHPEVLAAQRLPPAVVTKQVWQERYEDINAFERYLARNGTVIRKFFLHVSKQEQKKRFLDRLDLPDKNWKFSLADAQEREHFGAYMDAFEDAIRATATAWAPWYVVPADNKWFTRLVVAAAIVDALHELDLAYPRVDAAKRKELELARSALLRQDGQRRGAKRARA